jgi:hypothetical protein
VIGDHGKTWLYHYDPETKQQSMEWQHSGSLLLQTPGWTNNIMNLFERLAKVRAMG